MEIINLTNRKVVIEVPGWSSIIISPEEGELPSEPRENTIYIVEPSEVDKINYERRNDIVTPKGMTTTNDAYPRYAGCWYL